MTHTVVHENADNTRIPKQQTITDKQSTHVESTMSAEQQQQAPPQALQPLQPQPQQHWQQVYETKDHERVSWHRRNSAGVSMELIAHALSHILPLPSDTVDCVSLMDVGCGSNPLLVEQFLSHMMSHTVNNQSHHHHQHVSTTASITLVDIAQSAIDSMRRNIESSSFSSFSSLQSTTSTPPSMIHYVVRDMAQKRSSDDDDIVGKHHIIHDRAVFHFLNDAQDRATYIDNVYHSLVDTCNGSSDAYVIVGTFALPDGPTMCSGLPITRYSEQSLREEWERDGRFELVMTRHENHVTPSSSSQHFIFGLFKRK